MAPAMPVIASPRDRSAHRFVLLALLLAAMAIYAATGGWRRRLREESARSRRVIAALERDQAAQEQREEREKGLEAALASHPDRIEQRLELAQLRWADAGPAAAAMVLQAGSSPPADLRLLPPLAEAQRLMGREDLALATLDQAARRAPSAGNLQAQRAMLFSLMGWFPQAETALQEAARRRADPVRIALVRATMARQQGDLHAAQRELESARHRCPDNAEVIRQLAAVAEAEGQDAEARRLLASIAESEADPEVWLALARLSLRRMNAGGDPTAASIEARADLQRALALRPRMPAARLLLGRWEHLTGHPAAARTTLEPLCRERSQAEGLAFELAQVYREMGMRDRVRPLLARYQEESRRRERMRRAAIAVMDHPDNAQAHLEMGRLCLERGMIGRAILSFRRARALNPRLPGVREALADTRRAQ